MVANTQLDFVSATSLLVQCLGAALPNLRQTSFCFYGTALVTPAATFASQFDQLYNDQLNLTFWAPQLRRPSLIQFIIYMELTA